MTDLIISFIQSNIHWHSTSANFAMFEEKIWQIEKPVDLIILPEMFNTGFTMDVAAHAEPMNGQTMRWMRQMANQTGSVIAGSLIIREGDKYHNRFLWIPPDGYSTSYYNKRHLFRMAGEDLSFSAGHEKIILQWKGWRICPMICYDLRFPVWSRNLHDGQSDFSYDVLIYIANWPATRINAWDTLLEARAIENLSYVIGVNRIGIDGNDVEYKGHSNLIDFKGIPQFDWKSSEEIFSHRVNFDSLVGYRKKFPAHLDSDKFEISDL